VDELHAAIAAYLRRHNDWLRPGPIPRVRPEALRPLAHCRICDALIAGDEEARIAADTEVPALATLLAARLCVICYLASEAA
jgi:hypothetical protein